MDRGMESSSSTSLPGCIHYSLISTHMHLHPLSLSLSHTHTHTHTQPHLQPQVVIPNPKRPEDDVVIFLDERFAAGDSWEAEQRGAVAALYRVAGDRQLERTLPVQWRGMW